MIRLSTAMATVSCVIASIQFSGAVSADALGKFTLPTTCLGTCLGVFLFRMNVRMFLICATSLTFAWSIVVNAISGETSGPVARTSAMCGISTAIAMFGAKRKQANIFLAGISILTSSAMFYGSAGEKTANTYATLLIAIPSLACISLSNHDFRLQGLTLRSSSFSLLIIGVLTVGLISLNLVVVSLTSPRTPILSPSIKKETTTDFLLGELHEPIGEQSPPSSQINTFFLPNLPITEGALRLLLALFCLTLIALAIAVIRCLSTLLELWRWRKQLLALSTRESVAGSLIWVTHIQNLTGFQRKTNRRGSRTQKSQSRSVSHQRVDLLLSELENLAIEGLFARKAPTLDQVSQSWAIARLISSIQFKTSPKMRCFIALMIGT